MLTDQHFEIGAKLMLIVMPALVIYWLLIPKVIRTEFKAMIWPRTFLVLFVLYLTYLLLIMIGWTDYAVEVWGGISVIVCLKTWVYILKDYDRLSQLSRERLRHLKANILFRSEFESFIEKFFDHLLNFIPRTCMNFIEFLGIGFHAILIFWPIGLVRDLEAKINNWTGDQRLSRVIVVCLVSLTFSYLAMTMAMYPLLALKPKIISDVLQSLKVELLAEFLIIAPILYYYQEGEGNNAG